jgi:hypothetical protein
MEYVAVDGIQLPPDSFLLLLPVSTVSTSWFHKLQKICGLLGQISASKQNCSQSS